MANQTTGTGSNGGKPAAAEKPGAAAPPEQKIFMAYPEGLTIVTDKAHPLFDPRALEKVDPVFVANILENGVMSPPIVRQVGVGDKAIYEVIAGRRRVAAAKAANVELKKRGQAPREINVVVVQAGDDLTAYGLTVSENEIRKDDSPLGKARKVYRFLALGGTHTSAAVHFGVSESTVRNYSTLLECHQQVQEAVEAGRIGATVVSQYIGKIEKDKQPEALAKLLESGTVKGQAAKDAAKEERDTGGNSTARPAPKHKCRPAKQVAKAIRQVSKGDAGRDGDLVMATLRWVLGKDKAFDSYAKIKAAVAPPPKADEKEEE